MRADVFVKKVARRVVWAVKGQPKPPDLLELVWPETELMAPPEIVVPDGYRLRQFEEKDRQKYFDLFVAADMEKPSLEYWSKHILPGGFFVIEHQTSGDLVAACFASHHSTSRHSQAGNFGWLAVDPRHRGLKLGQAISAAVTSRLISAGYRRIYLETHDHRLPAISIYLKMGWIPLLYLPEMNIRWAEICKKLNWPYTPESWSK